MKRNILITGGAGFIGYHLAKELLEQGYDLVLADNFSRGVEDTFLKKLEENPYDLDAWSILIREAQV